MYQFAIIGCGRIAPRHAQNIVTRGKLIAVCDTDKTKADTFASQYGATAYYSIDELLSAEKGVDIMVVCTPNGFHAEHAIKSLQAGKHVVCEKPMCLTTSAAWSMMDNAHFFRKKLFVVMQNRYNGPVAFVKKLLDNGSLGKILSFQINCFWNRPQQYYANDWRGTIDLDGGLLYTQFSHFIDLLYWMLGDVEKVCGFKENNNLRNHLEVEDNGVASLLLKSGAIGSLHYTINSFERNTEGSFTIFAEKGTVKIGGQYLNTIEWLHTTDGAIYTPQTLPASPNDYGFYTGSMSNHHNVYQDVISALSNKETNLPQVVEAVKAVEIIEKIYKASVFK